MQSSKSQASCEMSPGMPLEDFWQFGKDYLSIHQHDQIYNEIRQIHLNADLIIGLVVAGESVITKVDARGLITWENSFTTIGSGGLIAQAFLHQYDWDEEIELPSCLFRVLSAKHASEKDPYVGPTTSFEILTEAGRYDVTDKTWEKLKRVAKVRPDPRLTITKADLEIIKDDEDEPESSDG